MALGTAKLRKSFLAALVKQVAQKAGPCFSCSHGLSPTGTQGDVSAHHTHGQMKGLDSLVRGFAEAACRVDPSP